MRGGYVVTFARVEGVWPSLLTLLAVPLSERGEATAPARSFVVAESYSAEHALTTVGENEVWSAYARVVAELCNVERIFTRTLTEEGTSRRRSARP